MQVKAQCEAAGQCDMGGFTRLLHSGTPDELMNEIPTFVANPLPDEGNKGYASSCTMPLSFNLVLMSPDGIKVKMVISKGKYCQPH